MNKLPPYGKMGEGYQRLLQAAVMDAWMPEAPLGERTASFNAWKQSIVDDISAHLWPRHRREDGSWHGAAVEFAEAATRLDLELSVAAFQSPVSILDQVPSSPNVIDQPNPHRWHYEQEDDLKAELAINYNDYDKFMSNYELSELRKIAQGIYPTKIAGLFSIKDTFLRPRPYQTSMILEVHNFKSEVCRSGLHPALNSGHCLEGIIFCCTILDRWIETGRRPARERQDSLAQFAVDFGDRRVFAGVHYLTDNIAGWTMALGLIPHFFPGKPEILAFARDAIAQRSRVYRTIQENFGGHEALAPALAMLDRVIPRNTPSV